MIDRSAQQRSAIVPQVSSSTYHGSRPDPDRTTSRERGPDQLCLKDAELNSTVAETGVVEMPTGFGLGDVRDADVHRGVDAVWVILDCPRLAVTHTPTYRYTTYTHLQRSPKS